MTGLRRAPRSTPDGTTSGRWSIREGGGSEEVLEPEVSCTGTESGQGDPRRRYLRQSSP